MKTLGPIARSVTAAALLAGVALCTRTPAQAPPNEPAGYQDDQTRDLVALVTDAARLVESEGTAAFDKFRALGTRWRHGETYIFVLDPDDGTEPVHPDPALEGKVTIDLKDVRGRLANRGLIAAATATPGKTDGWYHYEWPVPGGLLPRWKSSYVRLATTPAGKRYVVGSGMYTDRMERAFVVDMVKGAVARIQAHGDAAFPALRDPAGPFIVKDSYVFVIDPAGVERVNPAFPNLEGRNCLDVKDAQGKQPIREMLRLAQDKGAGWVDYMWPKPGESVPTQKSAYVSRVGTGDKWLLVGAGVYLADAPKATPSAEQMTAPQLMALVRDGAALFEKEGEAAYAQFRRPGSKWFHGDTYFVAYTLDGTRTFDAADPSLEGKPIRDDKDIQGRPYGRMFLAVADTPAGEGWVHYMYPRPGDIFPAWKSAFVKRVTAPSGKPYLIRSAVYNVQMDKAFIADLVDRAAALVAARGKDAFPELRDRTGPFVFMDTYVFVDAADGTQLVNPAFPALEGKNLLDLKDVKGKALVREYIDAASKAGSAWVEYYWYPPGENVPVRKQAYVRKVRSGPDTYYVGSGLYTKE